MKCNKDCFNCVHDDCLNDTIRKSYAEESKRYYQENKEKVLDYKMRVYYQRKNAGLCVDCGKKPPEKGKTRCTECLRKRQISRTKYNRAHGVLPLELLDGVTRCRLCGRAEPVEGYRYCESCLEKSRASIAYARTFINREKAREEHMAFMKASKSMRESK